MKNRRKNKGLSLAGLACAVLPSAVALAATAPASSNAGSTAGLLDDIVVTAEKTESTAAKTPLALSVFSADSLKQSGVENVDTLSSVSPSVNIAFGGPTGSGRGAGVAIRGVYTTDTTSKGEQAVSFNADGIAIGRPQVMQLSFFDVDRVEVLRGPQGTLYGKSSTGGAINVISAKPKDYFDYSASVEVGNYNLRRAEAMVNVPVSDNLALRFAGATNVRDGYLNPVLYSNASHGAGPEKARNDENNASGRVSALWKLGEQGNLLVQFASGHIGGAGNASGQALFNRYQRGGSEALEVYYDPMATGVNDHYSKLNTELNLNLGSVKLTYVGGYLKFSGDDNSSPQNGAPLEGYWYWGQYQATNKYNSHEIRLSNATPQQLEYVVGANYWRERTDERDMQWHTLVDATPAGVGQNNTALDCALPAPNLLPACNQPSPNIISQNQHLAKGIFGQLNYHVTDAWKVTAGLRYSSDSMYREGTIVAGPPPGPYWADANGQPCYPGNPCVNLANGVSGPVTNNDNGSQSAGKVTWKLGTDYQLAPNQMLYGYIATGYKAGSFNDIDPVVHKTAAYGPESMTAYEVGYKGRVRPNLQFNTSLYYYDYKRFQLTKPTFFDFIQTAGPPNVIIYTSNVPVKMSGWEGELLWNPSEDDFVTASVTLAKGTFSGGDNHATAGFNSYIAVDWTGKDLDNLPHAVGILSYEHRFHLSAGGYVSARLQSKISSSYYFTDWGGVVGGGPPFGNPAMFPHVHWELAPSQYQQSGYTRSEFHLGYTSATGKFEADAYVRNIENKLQLQGPPSILDVGATSPQLDSVSASVNAPRTFGVRVAVRY